MTASASAVPISITQSRRRRTVAIILRRGMGCEAGLAHVHGVETIRQLGHHAAAFGIAIGRPALDLDEASPAAAAKAGWLVDDADFLAGRFDRGHSGESGNVGPR